MPTVSIEPINKRIEINEDISLFEALKKNGIAVKSTCGGCASCGLCTVIIASGEENLTPVDFKEKQLLGNVFHITRERLSCQVKVLGDVTINIAHQLNQDKVKPVVRVRKRAEIDEKIEDAINNPPPPRPPRKGGMKRPKAFKTNKREDE